MACVYLFFVDQIGGDVGGLMDRVGSALSGITEGASLVLTPKHDEAPVSHIEFVPLAQDRAMVVIVFADGHVENRLFTPPPGQTPSSMREAARSPSMLCSKKCWSRCTEICRLT